MKQLTLWYTCKDRARGNPECPKSIPWNVSRCPYHTITHRFKEQQRKHSKRPRSDYLKTEMS